MLFDYIFVFSYPVLTFLAPIIFSRDLLPVPVLIYRMRRRWQAFYRHMKITCVRTSVTLEPRRDDPRRCLPGALPFIVSPIDRSPYWSVHCGPT